MRSSGVWCLLLAIAVTGCATDKKFYPVGWQGSVLTTRYGDDLPMTVYYPETGSKPFPVVVYNHGRPFGQIQKGDFKLSPRFPLISTMTAAGIAVALPVRSGYSPSSGRDRERITCNNPARYEFENAIKSARADVAAAVKMVKTLPDLDTGRVFVGGTSAGGFASGGSMAILQGKVKGIFILNGGRCGKRGSLFRGHEFAVDIFRAAAAESSIPVVFYASVNDKVIPPLSSWGLHQATCEARGPQCEGSVFWVDVTQAGHGQWDTTGRASSSLLSFVTQGQP